jgi:hypothetical protein
MFEVITIQYGMTSRAPGTLQLATSEWLREKGSVREFRKILKLCAESDYFFGTETLKAWDEVLTEELELIRVCVHNRTQEFNSHECDWTWTAEHKREFDRDMKRHARNAKKYEKLLSVLREVVK